MTEKKIRRHMKSTPSGGEKLTITLSEEAKIILEQLRLRLLGRDGKKPTPSEVLEALLKAALERESVPDSLP
ncbi:MAG: hypothetical protein ACREQW_14945 [Candidatus Binatia bacterium]